MNRGLSALLAALLALTACSSSDESSAQGPANTPATSPAKSPVSSPESELEDAYREYIDAFLHGDGATAYALLSDRCREKETLSEFAAVTEAAAELYGDVDYEIKNVTINGDRGTLDAEYAVEALNQGGGSEWVYEDGEWHSDKCD